MKQLTTALLCAGALWSQTLPAVQGLAQTQSGSGAPAGNCTAGLQYYVDISTTPGTFYYCDANNHWSQVVSWIIKNPVQTSLASTGNVQNGLQHDVYADGLQNPAYYGNIAGMYGRTSIFNGFNSWDNKNKDTLSGWYNWVNFYGSGQKAGTNINVNCLGAGDCFGASTFLVYNNIAPAYADEGVAGSSSVLFQQGNLVLDTAGTVTATTCAITALAAGISASTAWNDFKTVSVTGSTSNCHAGDWLDIDNGPYGYNAAGPAGDVLHESVKLTAVGGGSITALFHMNHSTGAPVAPSIIMGITAQGFGQDGIVVDHTATPYTTGAAAPTKGSRTVTGTGTSWSSVGVGDTNLPGCITWSADDFSQDVFTGHTLHSYYAIQSMSGTTMTLGRVYTGKVSTASSYSIVPCGVVSQIVTDQGYPVMHESAVVLRSSAFPWTAGHAIEAIISPNSSIGKVVQANWVQYGPMENGPAMYIATNQGYQTALAMFRVSPSDNIDSATAAGFTYGVHLEANTTEGAYAAVGKDLNGMLLKGVTFSNGGIRDMKQICWQGSTGVSTTMPCLFPDLENGGLVVSVNSSKDAFFKLAANTDANASGATFDFSRIIGDSKNVKYTLPERSGEMALANPGGMRVTTPNATNDALTLGSFVSVNGYRGAYDIMISSTADENQHYIFQSSYNNRNGAWATLVPISALNASTTFVLDVQDAGTGGGTVTFRLRSTGGGSTQAYVYIQQIAGYQQTWMPCASNCTKSVSPPAVVQQSTTISQHDNVTDFFSASGHSARMDLTSLTANAIVPTTYVGTSAPPCSAAVDIGRITWYDTNTPTTVVKICISTAGKIGWTVH